MGAGPRRSSMRHCRGIALCLAATAASPCCPPLRPRARACCPAAPHTRSKLASWKAGEAVPFKFMADTFDAIADTTKVRAGKKDNTRHWAAAECGGGAGGWQARRRRAQLLPAPPALPICPLSNLPPSPPTPPAPNSCLPAPGDHQPADLRLPRRDCHHARGPAADGVPVHQPVRIRACWAPAVQRRWDPGWGAPVHTPGGGAARPPWSLG